jgi:Putative binding domain, N-terminal/Viral BACON domain
VCLCLLALAAAPPAHAQIISNPRIAEFEPSPDHSVTLSDGQPAVSNYTLEIYYAGASAPFQTIPMGKPTPAGGLIHYDFSGQLTGWALPGPTYESRVAANGPGGTSRSAVSNQFLFLPPPCSYDVTPLTVTLAATAGSSSVAVTTTSGCTWLVTSNAAWLTPGATGGSGSGPVSFSVSANTSTSPRTAQLTVAGVTVNVTQQGACAYSVSPTTLTLPDAAGSSSVTVTTTPGCTWQVTDNASWLTPGVSSGTGSATVSFTVTANTSTSPRTAQLTVAGTIVSVTQQGACGYSVTPATQTLPAGAGSGNVTVTTTSGCTWQVSDNASWLTPTVTSGTGTATVTLNVTANTSTSPRTAQVTIAGTTVSVTQQGACAYTVTPATQTLSATAGSGTVAVTTTSGCTWQVSDNASWLTPTVTSGTGTATVTFDVTANPSASARSAQITIAGIVVTVSQMGTCTYSVSPTTVTLGPSAGSGSVTITTASGCTWQVSENASWLTPGVSSGTGVATVSFSVTANTSTSSRTTQLTIGTATVTVTQQAACAYTVAPTTVTRPATAGSGSVTITTTSGCTWQVSDNASWLTPAASSGTGSGTLSFSVTANTGTAARSAQLTVAGIVVTVTQLGTCNYSVTPTTIAMTAAGGSRNVTVTTTASCGWQVSSNASWLVPGISSGTGNGTVSVSIAANASSTPRTAVLTIGAATVTVNQEGLCDFTVTPFSLLLTAAPASSTISVTTTPGCSWQVTSNAPWLTPAVSSGSGSSAISINVSANQSSSARTGQLTVASIVVMVTQNASSTGDSDGDGMPDAWETSMGLAPNNPADGGSDPDDDGVSSRDEYARGTHPRGMFTRYFSEGAANAFFHTRFALLQPGTGTAHVLMRFLTSNGTTVPHVLRIDGQRRATLDASTVAALSNASFSTIIESDQLVVADRTMSWDSRGIGSHGESAIAAPSLTWYLAEGATHGGFDLFYLLQNPNETAAEVRIRYLRPASPPLEKLYTVEPLSRMTIWVDQEEITGDSSVRPLSETDVSAAIDVMNGQPIIVERAMYFSRGAEVFVAGHESAGVTQPSTRWFFAEGATGSFFDLYLLLANPTNADAAVQATYLQSNGATLEKTYVVRANSRLTLSVDAEEFPAGSGQRPLDNAAVSTIIETTNGVPIIAERSMWWPATPVGAWGEAHNSPGATATGPRWAVAEGEAGGARSAQTYVLIANTSTFAGSARVTVVFEDGASAVQTIALRPSSRTNVDVGSMFTGAVGKRFGVIVESLGTTPAELVVESSLYSTADGVVWAAGANALATPLP